MTTDSDGASISDEESLCEEQGLDIRNVSQGPSRYVGAEDSRSREEPLAVERRANTRSRWNRNLESKRLLLLID